MKKQLKQGKKYGFNYEEEKRIYKYACDSCKKLFNLQELLFIKS